ncbi:MAG: alpha/beta hydrolase family protein [Myxococcota bacterium]
MPTQYPVISIPSFSLSPFSRRPFASAPRAALRSEGLLGCIALLLMLLAAGCQNAGPRGGGIGGIDGAEALGDESLFVSEAATMDPPVFDTAHPPLIFDTTFRVEGAGLNAVLYEAQGVGPHPTAVLLHGFPGNEKNQDLAQAMRRAGWNALIFHYRGSWGSGGRFSFVHILEDVREVLAALRAPDFAAAHRVDPERIALVGHSMGGFAALVSGAERPEVDCVVSMAGANLGGMVLASTPEQVGAFSAQIDAWSGPIRGPGGAALVSELAENATRFNTLGHAGALAKKRVLLVAGLRDQVTPAALHHAPLVSALKSAGAEALSEQVYANGDHSFSGQRIALAQRVTGWLTEVCAP